MARHGRKEDNNLVVIYKQKEEGCMACFVPFHNQDFEISLSVFKPTVAAVDDLVEGLKHFSSYTESLGCLYSAVFRSIHGNMIIWYGCWMKTSIEDKDSLNAALISRLMTNVSGMATLIDQSFFDSYAGESTEHPLAAKLFAGDIISINSTTLWTDDMNKNDFYYACLAIFRSSFPTMDGTTAGVCLKSQARPRVVGLFVWRSLQFCYSYVLNTDYRKTVLPYLDGHYVDIKYDIFRVVYVGGNISRTSEFSASLRS